MPSFSWERGPFGMCPACQQNTFGILSAGGDQVTLRCTECRYSHSEALPALDKRVIYIDQSLFSLLFKVEGGGRLPPGHEEVTRELYRRLRRVVLLQQAILPHSDIHHDETIVFHSGNALRAAYERLGGDARLLNTIDVERMHVAEFAKAFVERREPTLSFDVDQVLEGQRNVWLRDMHLHVNANYQIFADGTRDHRDQLHEGMQRLVERWAAERPTLDQLLDRELRVILEKPHALLVAAQDVELAARSDDPMALLEAAHHPILEEHEMLVALFLAAGVPAAEVAHEVVRFWRWERKIEQPHHRISSYIYAALGKRVANGQRRVNRGMMNDVRAISTYAPYVDAMFIDKECAALLAEPRLTRDIQYKARIFSFSDPEAFLSYLDEMEESTPGDVRSQATRIYRIC